MSFDRTITLTVTDRPRYLAAVLASLARARDVRDWHLVVGLEPGDERCAALCEAIDFMPVTLLRNRTRLGVRGNPYSVLAHAFDGGSRLNIYLEDDTVVSPDVTALADWYAAAVPDDRVGDLRVVVLGLFFTSVGGEPADRLHLSPEFSPWGLVMTERQWRSHVEPQWWNDDHDYRPHADWTISLAHYLDRSPDLAALVPSLSRVCNIGREGGVHSCPERHDTYGRGLVASEGAGPFAYRIDPEARPPWRTPEWEDTRSESPV